MDEVLQKLYKRLKAQDYAVNAADGQQWLESQIPQPQEQAEWLRAGETILIALLAEHKPLAHSIYAKLWSWPETAEAEVMPLAFSSNPGPVGYSTGYTLVDPKTDQTVLVIAKEGESRDEAIKRVRTHFGL
jgi:hypothetical protein